MTNLNWFTDVPVSCDWECHRARGSLGGEDRVHPAGSMVLAPYDCTITYGMYGDGASYVQCLYDNGYAHRAIHIQKDGRVAQNSKVAEGTVIAYSDGRRGTYGAGTSTGPHIHFQGHDPLGNRIPWQDVPLPETASNNTKPYEPETEEDMEKIEIISIPVNNQQQYWLVNWGMSTKALISKGTQLDYLTNRGFPRLENQSEEVLFGLKRIDVK